MQTYDPVNVFIMYKRRAQAHADAYRGYLRCVGDEVAILGFCCWTQMGPILGPPRNLKAAVLVAEELALQGFPNSQATARSDTVDIDTDARTTSCS